MSLYEVFRGGRAEAAASFASPNIHHWTQQWCKTLYIIVEKPMSKAQNANLFRDPVWCRDSQFEKPCTT